MSDDKAASRVEIEKEIVWRLAEGQRNVQIAHELGIAMITVDRIRRGTQMRKAPAQCVDGGECRIAKRHPTRFAEVTCRGVCSYLEAMHDPVRWAKVLRGAEMGSDGCAEMVALRPHTLSSLAP